MTVRRARHYPTPTPAAELLAAERCDHGEIIGRCPFCRATAEPTQLPPGDQDEPEPAKPRPARRRVVRRSQDDPRPVDWLLW
jgi:hypothetical protein